MKTDRSRKTVNIFIAVAVPAAWLTMAFGGEGTLSSNGISSLKYFTVLSNILEGAASVVWLAAQKKSETALKADEGSTLRVDGGSVTESSEAAPKRNSGSVLSVDGGSAPGNGKAAPKRNSESVLKRAERLKYTAASAVALTFAVVMLFFGPLYGYGSMLSGANLFFHLLIPLAALAEMVFLTDAEYTLKDNNITVIAPLIYGTCYLANILINGIGEWPDTNDWYLFLAWGYPVGILIFAVICAVTWLLALLLRKVRIRK